MVSAVTDPRGNQTVVTRDGLGRLTTQTEPVNTTPADSITTSFGYDLAGNRTRFTDGRGNAFITTYNAWGLPESEIEPATTVYPNLVDRTFTTSYDAAGRVASKTSPGGVSVTNTYDTIDNLTGQTGTGAEVATTARTFGYDLAGRPTSVSGPGGGNTFTYDDRGLITAANGGSGNATFATTPTGR
jgi:YD repeat-containing protein